MRIEAWQEERDVRRSAVPLDRRLHPSNWSEQTVADKGQDEMMFMLWESRVPGSGAPECLYRGAAQSMENQGFDESVAVSLIPEGLRLARTGDVPALRRLITSTHCLLHRRIPCVPTSGSNTRFRGTKFCLACLRLARRKTSSRIVSRRRH